MRSNKDIEMSLIEETQLEVTRLDIFVLGDNLMEYLGHHASDYTKSRIESYLKWRDKRVETAKQIMK